MMNAQQLASYLEDAAATLGIAPSTLGERAGQGGKFYDRLKDNRRVWPETANKVRERVEIMLAEGRRITNDGAKG